MNALVILGLLGGLAMQEGESRPLTPPAFTSRAPSWSPGGSKIAFESTRSGNWDILLLDTESGSIAAVTSSPEDERSPTWSPDGSRIAFVRTTGSGSDLHISDLNSGDTRRVELTGSGTSEGRSPSGTEIAFSVGESPDLRLQILDLETGLVRDAPIPPGRDVWPRWSPDGETLAFFSRRDTSGQDDEIYALSLETRVLRRLTFGPGHDFCPAWAPDGERIVFVGVEDDGSRALHVMRSDGIQERRLARGLHRVTEPAWSPDGRSIVYAGRRTEGDHYRLYLIELDGSHSNRESLLSR